MTKNNHFRNVFYLALTALIWGVAFVFQSMGNDHMGAFSFTSVRYLLGGLVLVPIVSLFTQKTLPGGIEEKFSCYNQTVVTNQKTSLG